MRRYLSIFRCNLRIGIDFYLDCKKYINYSFYSNKNKIKDTEHLEGIITRLYHGVEKGLSVREFKKEFGLKNIDWLQNVLLDAKNRNFQSIHVDSAIVTLKKYYSSHDESGSDAFNKSKEFFFNFLDIELDSETYGGVKCLTINDDASSLGYKEFFSSRQSVREFDGELIDEETIINAIDIAKHCPSACNRQAIKIYYSLDPKKNAVILSHQNGSRAFRDNVPALLIVCSDIRYQEGAEERHLGFVEGGIWILSLINALHYMNLGSCVLNWCVRAELNNKFINHFEIPPYHEICAMIAVGKPVLTQKTPYSVRRNNEDFLEKII
ncbi:nitroreductase family protein [Pectobacterium carotovorum]|uniref:nitroreductase family protein n=1 Tax=Pectobacterium carotovorum TaxID=554 RepID=UPI00068929E8|nr:nitroreductase family protein [Pectobacterium carotovorum]MBA0178171.1 nitroreductase family protein [Pectobacterium carotovorum]MBB1527441.1 nitroreductase family protein [Pectobacterium carotovorum subsp. carotovorum]MCA6965379.1 nitroreductase family protein [Pectobacterium carotovorum]MCH4987803.1 nitroreductase family protein [Pectobacterium carotovorum]